MTTEQVRSHYELNGLELDSSIDLPTLRRARSTTRAARCIRVRAVETVPGLHALPLDDVLYTIPRSAEDQTPYMTVARRRAESDSVDAPGKPSTHRDFLLRIHGLADFVVDGRGESILCAPASNCAPESVEQLLVDQIIPRVMHLRGEPCLHSSAVALPSQGVIALLGETGAGKSTTCAALCERGGVAVCDDSLAVRMEGSRVRVFPGYPSLRVWSDSARALYGSADTLPLASPRTDKRRVLGPTAEEPLYLTRVLVLGHGEGDPELCPLSGLEAVRELTLCLPRLDPEGTEPLDAEFRLLTDLAARIPIERLRFRHDWDELDRVLELIMSL